jgi:WD40 repeat protein
MADEPRDRLEALFHQAVELPQEERSAFLAASCANDPDLRKSLEHILEDDDRLQASEGNAFLSSVLDRQVPSQAGILNDPVGPTHLPQVGRYRILRLLGEGGMGAVYEAEQDNPRRSVALKVIRPGLVTPSLFNRFSQEAQILGRLHHPGIATIYEAGVAEDGQPYFALELVRGSALDVYARERNLTPVDRLELMARVCDAVHYAHDRGVVHRDLKPSNILVDETGQPKVLDFGVARVIDDDLPSGTGHTRTGQMVGTLDYMSPEQVMAQPGGLDRRSDVYALGVILFELLAGRLPYQLEHVPLPQAAELIGHREPDRLGTIDFRFRGDVETILAKTLEKEPARRYSSAADLAEDIRLYMRNEPIRARPPSALYQLGKFARRHKALVSGVSAVIVALTAGLVATAIFAARESEQRSKAEKNAKRADDEKQVARYEAYRARMAAANAALQNDDVADAARHLAEAPAELRGWEWRHLSSRLDDSYASFPSPAYATYLWPQKNGLRREVQVNKTLQRFDETGRIERSIPVPDLGGKVLQTVGTPDGLFFLDMVADGVLRVRQESGKEKMRLKGPTDASPGSAAASPDQKWLAIAWKTTAGLSTRVYDSSGNERVSFREIHTRPLWALTFSPDGRLLATASDDGTGWLWNVETGRAIGGPLTHPGKIRLRSAAFRPDSARLVTTSADGTVCQWDTDTGKSVVTPNERHTGEVWTAVYSPDGQWIASAGTDRTIRVWPATGRREVQVLYGHTGSVTDLAFTGDGSQLISVSEDNTARLWEVDRQNGLPVLRGHTDSVYAVAYSPDGQWIATGSWDKCIRLWDARTGESCARLPQAGVVRVLAFSPDGSWLVSGSDGENQLSIWDMATGLRRNKVPGPGVTPEALAVNPAGTQIAAADRFGRLIIVDVATGKLVASRTVNRNLTRLGLAYSPDSRWLAATGTNHQVWLFDAETYEFAATLLGHTGDVHSVAFRSDSQRLASTSNDRTVRVWDITTTTCLTVLKGHTDEVFDAVFHPDGTRLASAGRDRAVWIWDLAAPGEDKLAARLSGHANYIFSLSFSPDGKTLASASGDNTVRLWDTEPPKARHEARRALDVIRPEAEQLVSQLIAELKNPSQVRARLLNNEKLSAPLRRAAMQLLVRRNEVIQ